MVEFALGIASAIGVELLPWQELILRDWAATDEDGTWANEVNGLSVPRQNGKSVVGLVWATALMLAGYKVLWTEHNYSTTTEMLRRFREVFGARPMDETHGIRDFNRLVTSVNSKTAQEAIFLSTGGQVNFSTRTKSASLGYSFDVVFYDEAQQLTYEQQQAISPTTTSGAKHNPQKLMMGTPPRPGDPGTVFKAERDRALGGEGGYSWNEWGVDEVGDVRDEARWYDANPSLGTSVANVKALRQDLSMLPLAFAQDHLGYWLPDTPDAVILPDEWDACETSPAPPSADEKLALGVKFSPDGLRVAVAACALPEGGVPLVELPSIEGSVEHDTTLGIEWLAQWLASRADRYLCVVVDGKAMSGNLVQRLEELDVPEEYVVRPRADEAVTAAAGLLADIKARRVTHSGQRALKASATTATRRKIGSNGGWGFGGENPYPVEAAGLALWGARTCDRSINETQEAYFG